MKKTTRFLVLLSLCFCFVAIGVVTVFAATQASLQSSGQISFVAQTPGIDATVSGARLQGLYKESDGGNMQSFKITPDMTSTQIQNLAGVKSWQTLKLGFVSGSQGFGRLVFTITNNSKDIDNNLFVELDSDSDLTSDITATPSADFCIQPGKSHTFDIEVAVQEADYDYASESFIEMTINLTIKTRQDVYSAEDDRPKGEYKYYQFYYNETEGTAELAKYTGSSRTSCTVPKLTQKGDKIYTVTGVGVSAFSETTAMTTVTLPRTLTYIDDWAFHGSTSLTGNFVIPSSVERIGDNAFDTIPCTGQLHLSERLKRIGAEAFAHSKFSGFVIFPRGLEYIDHDAFWDCTSITQIVLREGLKNIRDGAFQGSTNIAGELLLPNSLTYIGNYAFSGCSKLTGTLVIPSGVVTIGQYAFKDCTGFTELSLTEGIQSIYPYAFWKLNLSNNNLYLPSTLGYIGTEAFRGCKFTGRIVIPEGMEEIEYGIFVENEGITSLVLPSTVYYVEDYAFGYTDMQEIITYAEEPPEYFQGSFEQCTNIYVADYLYDVYMANSDWNWIALKKLSDYPV